MTDCTNALRTLLEGSSFNTMVDCEISFTSHLAGKQDVKTTLAHFTTRAQSGTGDPPIGIAAAEGFRGTAFVNFDDDPVFAGSTMDISIRVMSTGTEVTLRHGTTRASFPPTCPPQTSAPIHGPAPIIMTGVGHDIFQSFRTIAYRLVLTNKRNRHI